MQTFSCRPNIALNTSVRLYIHAISDARSLACRMHGRHHTLYFGRHHASRAGDAAACLHDEIVRRALSYAEVLSRLLSLARRAISIAHAGAESSTEIRIISGH